MKTEYDSYGDRHEFEPVSENRNLEPAELWAAAQILPGEGIENGIARIEAILQAAPATPADQEPVGTAAAMPGVDDWTVTVCRSVDVPIGTPLYTRAPAGLKSEPPLKPVNEVK